MTCQRIAGSESSSHCDCVRTGNRLPSQPSEDVGKTTVIGECRIIQAGPFGDGGRCAPTVRSADGHVANFGQGEQRGSPVLSDGCFVDR